MVSDYLDELMEKLGYVSIGKNTYKLSSNNNLIEHFIYFYRYQSSYNYICSDFGIRNLEAEDFSIKIIKKFGGKLYEQIQFNRKLDCKLRFSLGRLSGWSPRWSILIRNDIEAEVSAKIYSDIRDRLIPLIKPIVELRDFLSVLCCDESPWLWSGINGGIRCAQIIYLGLKCEMPRSEIFSNLKIYQKIIASSLVPRYDPTEYIESIFQYYENEVGT